MKNLKYKQDNKQHDKQKRKYQRQVSHLSSFIGMPMWNGHNPSLSDIHEYDRRLLEKQAQDLKHQSFESKRKSSVIRVFSWLSSIGISAFNKIVKVGVKIDEKKESVKGSPRCC